VNYRTAKLLLEKLQLALHKQYARMGNNKSVKPNEETLKEESEQQSNEEQCAKKMKNTGVLAKYLFKNSRKVKYAEQDMFRKWMSAFSSVYLYPYFLRYFQVG
jgi:ribosomal protein L15E